MGTSTDLQHSENPRGSGSTRHSVEDLRHLIRQEVDRRLAEIGFQESRRQPSQYSEADEVAEILPVYDAGSWPPGMLANVELAKGEQAESEGPVDEEGEPLPSTLPEVAKRSLSTSEAAARLGVNDSRIRQRLGDGSLYGFKFQGSWCLPEWQFDGSVIVPHLDEVIAVLCPNESPVGVTRWFVSTWADLLTEQGRLLSPRRWLLEGRDPAPVVAQASMA